MYRLFALAFTAIAAMGVLALVVAPQPDPAPQATAPAEEQVPADATGLMVLKRDNSGQFHVNLTVNGTDTRFLVDTGADLVALTEADADALDILPTEDQFQPVMQTASGVGYAAPVMLDEVTLGETTFRDVEAVVVKGLGTNLLGQSLLRRLGKVELQGDKMVIRH